MIVHTGPGKGLPIEDDRVPMTEQESRLKALVEAAEDIQAGRVWTVEEFKPRLAKLRARAERISKP